MVNFGMTALKSKMDSVPYKRFPEKCVTVRTDPSWDREGVPVLLARCPKTSHFCRLQIIDSTEFRIAAIGRPESEMFVGNRGGAFCTRFHFPIMPAVNQDSGGG